VSAQPRLAEALHRSVESYDPDVELGLQRVSATAARRRGYRRRGAVALAVAAVAALAAVGLVIAPWESSRPAQSSLHVGTVSAGSYDLPVMRSRGFRVTLGAGWRDISATPDDVRFGRAGSPGGLLGFAAAGGVIEPGTSARVVQVPDLVGWLKGHPDLVLVGSHPRTVGTLFGTDLELRVRPAPSTHGIGCTNCVPLLSLPGTTIAPAAGDRLHVLIVNVSGRPLIAYSYAPAGAYREWAAAADAVMASLTAQAVSG
jgi:hypothetical protein